LVSFFSIEMTIEDVRTVEDIRTEIEQLSERRTGLWRRLAEGHDEQVARELKALDAQLTKLYDTQRAIRAQMRFGERSDIVARARMEERLERAA
jgi:hypothetical protein